MGTFQLDISELGSNRGGREIARALAQRPGVTFGRVQVVDPKPGRAEDLAHWYQRRGARVEAIVARAEDVLEDLDPTAPRVVTVDDIGSMAQVVERQPEHLLLSQGVARGPGAAREPAAAFGVSLRGVPGRAAERRQVVQLLSALARLTPPQSSAVIREESGVSAVRLHRIRAEVSRLTVTKLLDRERTMEEEHLAELLWGGTSYPLVVASNEANTERARREQALDLAVRGHRAAVALVSASPRVDFYFLEPRRSGASAVSLWVPFQRLLPPPKPFTAVSESSLPQPLSSQFSYPGAFTD